MREWLTTHRNNVQNSLNISVLTTLSRYKDFCGLRLDLTKGAMEDIKYMTVERRRTRKIMENYKTKENEKEQECIK